MSTNPASSPIHDILANLVGKQCIIELLSGNYMEGILCTIDNLFNLVLKDASEFDSEKVKVNSFSKVFIRGNHVLHVSKPQN